MLSSSRDFSLLFDVKVQPPVYRMAALDPIITKRKQLYILTLISLRIVLILFHVTTTFIIRSLASRSLHKKFCSFFILHVPYIIIIIIIIWHYSPLWVFAFSAKSLQVLISLAVSFQFLTFSFFRSSITSSCRRCLGLPTGLVPIGF